MYRTTLISIPGPYPLGASRTTSSVTTKNAAKWPLGDKMLSAENHFSRLIPSPWTM